MKTPLLMLLLLFSVQTMAQIGISPRILDIDAADAQSTHSFRLFNFSKKDYKVTVSLSNWTMNENNVATVIPATPRSMDQWTIVNPLRFSIAAGSTQTIRLAFQPPVDLSAGEYRTMVYFEQVLEDPEPDTKQLRSLFKLGAAVYLHVGEKHKTGALNKVMIQPDKWLMHTQNTGNSHIRYKGYWYLWATQPHAAVLAEVENAQGAALDKMQGLLASDALPTTPVLPGQTRNIPIDISQLDSVGSGVLQIKGKLGDEDIDVFVPIQ